MQRSSSGRSLPALGGVARGQCLSTGIRQRRHHPPVGGLVQLEKSPALKQSSRPDLVGTQEYVRLLARCLQDGPHGGCESHWSLMCFSRAHVAERHRRAWRAAAPLAWICGGVWGKGWIHGLATQFVWVNSRAFSIHCP